MTGETHIYALKHPITGEIRYIGKANNIQKRLKSHLRDSRRRKTPLYSWISKLQDQNMMPDIVPLSTVSSDDWMDEEKRQIAIHKKEGFRLLNVAEGGEQPFCDIETRRRNGKSNALAIHSDERKKRIWYLKQRIGHAIKAGELTESQKQKIRLAAQKSPHIFGKFATI